MIEQHAAASKANSADHRCRQWHRRRFGESLLSSEVPIGAGRSQRPRLSTGVQRTSGGCLFRAGRLVRRKPPANRLLQHGIREFSSIDILINNAGFQHICPLEAFPVERLAADAGRNVDGTFLLTQGVWPGMKHKGWGRIVNIGSIHSQVASRNKVGYTSAKHGLIGLTKTAALEGGPLGITANAICPAYVRTPLVEQQIASQAEALGISQEAVRGEVFLKSAATGSLIDPSEISNLALYLCSENAKSVTGASWNIDCGWTAQ